MSDGRAAGQPFMVSIFEPREAPETLVFTYVPKGLQQTRAPNQLPKRVPQYVVYVRGKGEDITFDWRGSPDDPGEARAGIETDARRRVDARVSWIALVADLVAQVEDWAKQLGWTTRRIDKRLDDSQIGNHHVPALLMQEDTCRLLLEPISRSSPGAQGVVDLYLMPAYDDIASIYFYGHGWHLHYAPPSDPTATVGEKAAVPFSKETLQGVLEELKKNAA